ncbi:MAG: HypC/HybG/HupF family hydrogenase formation chaperone [Gammaproteobacteria bacterium]|nr:HypC/HybG/HupF family hydrogenase formation chaperone [Gammaproteobacteria bacterium]MBT3724887.1 HypC/HybG/HupF family hydrogenase formation chaperone [Gammaproteobacteria bacterium]MBT4077303.1 HypC/HybG/HupF family hydrogenase formation chaperone [Gammaproteobacteria bacterium]MBT4192962.1 HypC/HybG/HupF family hydrogenase formation chaperone [Gammaproteobacteria bacterium]MBT4450886.1 HypC/HybG/HupF family hydrogenase formation chaperone [Gammaproteobacteria bacterium]
MCLGIPMQIKQINGYSALCEARGIKRKASLLLMLEDNLQTGDYVMISVGNIISKIDKKDAQIAWDLYDEMFATLDSNN